MQYFSALLSLGSLAAVATTVAAQQVPFVRDPAFPDCGNTLVTPKLFPPIIADPSPVPGTQRMMSKPYKSDSVSPDAAVVAWEPLKPSGEGDNYLLRRNRSF